MFVEPGIPPRAGQVLYDRASSAFAHITADQFPLEALAGAALFHLSGITPLLSRGAQAAAERAWDECHQRGILTSFDLNYRAKLAEPAEAYARCVTFLQRADLLFVNRRDVAVVLGIEGPPEVQLSHLKELFPQAICIMTAGSEGAYSYERELLHQPAVPGTEVDRVGRGDAFCAGFLWGYLREGTSYGLRCGTALASLQQTYYGDLSWSSQQDLLTLLASSSTDSDAGLIR